MIAQKKRPDLDTLIQLAEKKSPYLTITRTPICWTVAGKDTEPAAVEYESLTDALMSFILGDDHHGDSGE